MLPPDDGVLVEVRHVCDAGFATGFEDHPADVGPEKTVVCAVGVKIGVGIAVVSAMTTTPPFDRAFDGTRTSDSEDKAKHPRGVVRTMRPQTMIPCRNTKSISEAGCQFLNHNKLERERTNPVTK